MKRMSVLAVCLALCFALAACGGASGGSANSTAAAAPQEAASYDSAPDAAALRSEEGADLGSALPQNRKIILNADIEMEATDFSATCAALRAAAQDAGGYLANSQQETPSYEGARRWTRYTFRIPAGRYSEFLNSAAGAGNVVSLSESSDDVTADYVDVEARITALEAQQERLLAMLEQAGELETLLAIQDQLTEVQYRLESYESQKRVYDDQVDYSTITVTVNEVVHLTQKTETFGQRVGAAFGASWRDFGSALQDFAVWLVYALPALLVLAAAALCVLLVVRGLRRRPRKAPTPRTPAQYPAPPAPHPEGKEAPPHE